ncbi:MAG: bifunctional glutamate N-acetyltransferase/amino-acid acetyltransferase ArgJ [Gammaproteobacteria bacterium]|nr:bifunctional glutamate N-acetyltransferase/amino-acid acetyltransferase ArgJ [Gammaproteobacteria bacterium]MDH3859522.1 bifunctional glutamate N-acetyltransferase/amino-acid acetyltransferase ArgJ [Gammaproteobacteria bacterium]
MAVGLKAPGKLYPVRGIRLSAAHSGIKQNSELKDLVLIETAAGSSVAAVFTRNRFCAAPVTVARRHLAKMPAPRYLLINSGNANAGTGDLGIDDAVGSCAAVADVANVNSDTVLPFSTGVIATPLPRQKIVDAVPSLYASLAPDNWLPAAEGIMTTDTLPKAFSTQLMFGENTVSITGISKGSGMIKPDMATMLSYVATDALIETGELQSILRRVVASSFNSITVDGDTSTNDACVLIATGASGQRVSIENDDFVAALTQLFEQLAQAIIRDAEGATKFVEIEVLQARDGADAREVADCIAHSPLVKTALFASDPNWGRILAAIGRARVDNLDIESVDLYLGDTCLLRQGLPDPTYTEASGQAAMDGEEIKIRVNLNQGDASARIWTSDLSYEYVRINAEYRS